MRATRSARLLAAAAVVALVAGCADDPMTDSIRSERQAGAGDQIETPKSAVLVRVASVTAARGDTAMAASLYRRAHSLDPASFDAAIGLARTLAQLNAPAEAVDAYRAALKLRPGDPEALRGLGNTLIVLDQPAQALPQFEQALKKSNDPRLYNGLGVAHDMLDDYKMAQAYYRTGLELAPGNVELTNNLGLSLLLSGDAKGAVGVLRKLAGSPQATPRHRLNLALALVLAGEDQAATEVVRMDLDPASANAQIAYFETLKAISNPKAMRAAIGAHIAASSHGG
jgi:Flp pilus assembly protein TadD